MMSVISFVSSKGGAGKTTSAILLATALAQKHSVTVIDADEKMRLNRWANKSRESIGHIDVKVDSDEMSILTTIERAKQNSEFVVVDTKGERSRLNDYIMGASDLVIVAMGEDYSEATDGIQTIADIRQESRYLGREIPFIVLFTRVISGNKATLFREVNSEIRDNFDCLEVEIPHLAAYAALHKDGGTIWDYKRSSVPNLTKAIDIAELLAINVRNAVSWFSPETDEKLSKKA